MLLSTPVESVPGIGSVTARNLKKLDLYTIGDLLLHFPFRYEDFSERTHIENLTAGQTANITATIELIQNKRSPKRRMYITEALVNDGTDSLRVIWFNQPFLTRNLKPGDELSLAGRVTEDFGGLVMTSPQYEILRRSSSSGGQGIHTQGIVPVYHLTGALTQKGLRSVLKKVVSFADQLIDWLPEGIVRNFKLEYFAKAIEQIHFPKTEAELERAKERLGFNELFLLQLSAQRQRQAFAKLKASSIPFDEDATKNFVKALPFDLTTDQKRSAWEIIKNLGSDKPMLRLLQGDVGSGKTVVAALAMLNVARAKRQSALMVPTEILAAQHFETLTRLFSGEPIKIALLTSGYHMIAEKSEVSESSKKEIQAKLKAGEIDIIIGTQALIQKDLEFSELAFVTVDEQHRFGVEQRKLLTEKVVAGTAPHLLSMTATPIPRSLALAIYGDLDVSLIKEMPVGRKKIVTKIVSEDRRADAYEFIAKELAANNQAFVICPLIDESDMLGVTSVKAEFERLDKNVFKNYPVALLHGRMKTKEREQVMADFVANKIKVLVATSIIEIGIDIPNATVMMVEDADRFGLAQLHQYRGRVGRREAQSFCFLMTQAGEKQANHRLEAMVKFDSGFDLANVDLKFRGPGEVYGLVQKGFPELKMANFYDVEMIKKAREAALQVLEVDPNLSKSQQLRQELGEWEERAHLE